MTAASNTPRPRPGAERKLQAVLDGLHSDKAREVFLAIWNGEVDEDLDVILRNGAIRGKNAARQSFPLGSRVKVVGSKDPNLEGKEGVVAKLNPKRVVVFLDQDWQEWMGPREKMTRKELAEMARFGFPRPWLQRVDA